LGISYHELPPRGGAVAQAGVAVHQAAAWETRQLLLDKVGDAYIVAGAWEFYLSEAEDRQSGSFSDDVYRSLGEVPDRDLPGGNVGYIVVSELVRGNN
jgi:hypothetical protein